MCGIILNDGVADLLEPVYPVQDFHPNIPQHDFLPSEFDLPLLSFCLQYFTHLGLYGGRCLPAVSPDADILKPSGLLWGLKRGGHFICRTAECRMAEAKVCQPKCVQFLHILQVLSILLFIQILHPPLASSCYYPSYTASWMP